MEKYEGLLAAKDTHELAHALLALPPAPLGEEDRGERWANIALNDEDVGIIDICVRNV